MDSTLWKLNDRNCSEFVRDVRLTLHNQQADVLTFNVDGEPYDSAEVYAYGDSLSLYKGGVRWFAGLVISGQRFGSATRESHDYEAAGLWWYLDNLTFQQEWRVKGSTNLNKSHVVLGRDIDNNIVPISTVIAEALDYAISKGAPFTYDSAELAALSAEPPTDEQTDITCSEVIRKMLRWVPDTACWFDYSALTPILHFTRRGAAAAVQLPCIGDTEQIDIRSREDLVKDGVIINYERIDTIDGERIPALETDSAGNTSNAFRTALFTVNIAGMQISTQCSEIIVESIDGNSALSPDFWSAHMPSKFGSVTGLSVVTGTNPPEVSTHPAILISGAVAPWMEKEVVPAVFTATLQWVDGAGSYTEPASLELNLTDAESKVYTRELSFTKEDDTPVGLASMLLDALSTVHWQGSFNLVEEECAGSIGLGNVLNLTGGLSAWSTMRAAIQQIDFEIDSGRTSIAFGPPEKLGLDDYIALLNANRKRITHYSGNSRSEGETVDDIEVSGKTANTNGMGLTVGVPKITGEQKENMTPNLKKEDDGSLSIQWGYRKLV